MSHTDLEFCQQELPKIRILRLLSPEIKPIQTPEQSEAKSGIGAISGDLVRKFDEEDEEECRTPTAEENRIPEMVTCPPAPRKSTAARAPGCKRKLSPELDFFDAVNRDEVESFFRSSFVAVKAKRSNCCPCK